MARICSGGRTFSRLLIVDAPLSRELPLTSSPL
jgi:hypothetical protein